MSHDQIIKDDMKINKELEAWKDAYWDYLLEHSDIQESGALFVKFHTRSRVMFEKHVFARVKGYHRGDPREREKEMVVKAVQKVKVKKMKHEKWKADKDERVRIMRMVKRENELRKYRWGVRQVLLFLFRSGIIK